MSQTERPVMTDFAATYPEHIRTLCRHHDEALNAAGLSGVAIHSGQEIYRFLDDNAYPFAANPHFLWWAPLTNLPQSWVLYRPGERPRMIYFQPEDYWHLPPSDPEGYWTDAFDIDVIRNPGDVADLLPSGREDWACIGEPASLGESLGFGQVNPTRLLNELHYRRTQKTDYEVQCMVAASQRGARAHQAAADAFRDGESEFGIHLAYMQAASQTEAELPYTNIIALNEHGAVLHYHGLDRRPPQPSRSFLIDAGARVNGYASDITRTYAAQDNDFAALVRAMDERQQQLVADCRPGVDYRDLHVTAHGHVADLLVEFGIARASRDELLEKRLTTPFFPHGLGHLIGLQVHDVAGFQAAADGGTIDRPDGHPFLRLTRVLEPGMVTTIEPGLYFIDSLLAEVRQGPERDLIDWERVAEFRPFGGVRIEDDVLITEQEPRNLTREAFAEL